MQGGGFRSSLRVRHLDFTWERGSSLAPLSQRWVLCRVSLNYSPTKTDHLNQSGACRDWSAIKFMRFPGLAVFGLLGVLAGFPGRTNAAEANGGVALWRLDRSATLESGEFDPSSQRLVAQLAGRGEFLVRTERLQGANMPLSAVRVFYVYANQEALRIHEPIKRIVCRGDKPTAVMASDRDETLVSFLLELLPWNSLNEEKIRGIVPTILSAAVYASDAELLRTDSRVNGGLGIAKGCAQDKLKDLCLLCTDPIVARSSDGNFVWQGRFLLGNGRVEEVTVTIPSSQDRTVGVKRLELKPRNSFETSGNGLVGAETWVVSNGAGWCPPKRYAFVYTLASLGNPKAKYQLGTALIEELDESAKIEGLKWLRAAAQDGYGDAAARLALIEADPRPLHDRESVRKDSCCRLPPRL